MKRARILLADDHAEFMALVARIIDAASDLQVIKTFSDGSSIVDQAAAYQPDLCVLDISMAGLNGLEAARRLKQLDQGAKIVFLTVHDDQDYLRAALATGASGYIVKARLATDLIFGLREALAGRQFVSHTESLAAATLGP